MGKKIIFCILFLTVVAILKAQEAPAGIKEEILKIHASRFFSSTSDADDIMRKVRENKSVNLYTKKPFSRYDYYRKTSVDVVFKDTILQNRLQKSKENNNFATKYFVKPLEPWFRYARPTPVPGEMELTTLIYEDYSTVVSDHIRNRSSSMIHASRSLGFFEMIGQKNISFVLDEVFGNVDLYQDQNEIMLLSFVSPLSENAGEIYTYRLNGNVLVNGERCFEIGFYSNRMKENALAGCLYISDDGQFSLVKARFTLNNPESMNFLKNLLITQDYIQKDSLRIPSFQKYDLLLGDEIEGGIEVERTCVFSGFEFSETADNYMWGNDHADDYTQKSEAYWDSIRPLTLTPSQQQIGDLLKEADLTPGFRRMQDIFITLLNNHIIIGGFDGPFEVGPLTQMVSYNDMEGFRLKIGGNTTVNLTDHFLLGGYVAYGFTDQRIKYRTNLIYSLLPRNQYIWEYPKRMFTFTFVNDLNIPGQDLLTTTRDNFVYSFSHASTNNMSLQKIGLLKFENEGAHNFSYSLGGKFMYDNPQGVVKYMQVQGLDTTVVNSITTTEIELTARYSPREKFIQNRDKRVYIRRGDVELNLRHRIGLKNLFGSDYNYQITDFNAYKKFNLSRNAGSFDVYLSGGQVWNRIPFPLLFVPEGNQSYIFKPFSYNCMNFYEFTTDRFIAGNVNFMFNWSIFRLFSAKNKIKTTLGSKVIYGPLSDRNNPDLHPDLFVFNEGVTPLGNTPYAEVNLGMANIFKILRVEYVRRLTYLNKDIDADGGPKTLKGSILVTGSFSF